jgi:polysaccharide biosynthesis/export protein
VRTTGNCAVQRFDQGHRTRTGAIARLVLRGLLVAAGAALTGCGADSFFDPSTVGRWQATPTTMPIVDRLSAIEDQPSEFVQTSPVLPSDLVPEADSYRIGPGDSMDVHIQDYIALGKEEVYDRLVDARGYIDIPRLAPIKAQGLNSTELKEAIEQAIRDKQIIQQPVVAINLKSQRKQTFSVLGAVQTPGTYFIPSPDYRLLEGLTSAGSLNETLPYLYVVRQVRLTDAAMGKISDPEPARTPRGSDPSDSGAPAGQAPKKGEDLIDLIDEMTKKPGAPKNDAPKSPGAFGDGAPAAPTRAASAQPPAIDLPDANRTAPSTPAPGGGGWVYADGKWVRARPASEDRSASQENLVTQRVIKIPIGPLLAGAADVNIVLRPGDVVRAPVPKSGLVYLTGQVARPGPYSLPTDGRLTLMRAIVAAGGLGNLAIPEKVDLTRMVGNDRQATIMLNLRAISQGNQPDIYIKPDDQINVGTNFWAYPVAILRSGLRASYGFGFILDRNFQGDVFGVDRASLSGGG